MTTCLSVAARAAQLPAAKAKDGFGQTGGEMAMKNGLSRGLWLPWMLLTLGIAWLDYATGSDVIVWGLYLVPVILAAWMEGMRIGLIWSLVASGSMLAIGLLQGYPFKSLAYFLVALGNFSLALAVVAWLASRLYRKQVLESTLDSYEGCLDYYHVSPESAANLNRPVPVPEPERAAVRQVA
jgi:hypothetical protein